MSTKPEATNTSALPENTDISQLDTFVLLEKSASHLTKALSESSERTVTVWGDSFDCHTYDFTIDGLISPDLGYHADCVLRWFPFEYSEDYPIAVRYGVGIKKTHCIVYNHSELLTILQSVIKDVTKFTYPLPANEKGTNTVDLLVSLRDAAKQVIKEYNQKELPYKVIRDIEITVTDRDKQ